MTSTIVARSVSSFSILGQTTLFGPALALLLAVGCSSGGEGGSGTGGSASGNKGGSPANGGMAGTTASGGTTSAGGAASTGGTTSAGGATTTGGATSKGGATSTGGTTSAGGATTTGGATSKGGAATTGGATSKGGAPGTGGAGKGGNPSTGGVTATGGSAGSSGAGTGGGTSTVDCSAAMPTDGKTYTGSSVNGTVNGLNYGIWTNGSGGSITVFPNAHAFSTSWSESKDFLAHLGLDFYGSAAKAYTAFGTITAQYAETKTGTAGGFSMIGIYGWTQSPCVEWYINEDSYNGLNARGNVTATIDGDTYYLSTVTTTGTGGANACESGHTGSWTQMISTRKTARQCGTVTVSDHFAAWEKQGWTLGKLTMVHINVEVGGGTGSIQFPVANVTTTSK